MVRSLLQQRPNTPDTPWRLVLYSDEITPGNQVAHKNPRKTWAIYYSFLEFGPLLGSEDFWLTGLLLSTETVKQINGGWSSVIRQFCRMLWGPDGLDMEVGGISIVFEGGRGRVQLFVKLGVLLADEAALNSMLHSKGASGLKCCACCQNVFDAKTDRLSVRQSEWGVLRTEANPANFILHTTGSIGAIVTKLRSLAAACAAGEAKKGQLKSTQTNLGFSHNEHAILFDDFLRPKVIPSKSICWDWMHVWLVSGIFQSHAGRFLKYWHDHAGTPFQVGQLHDYLTLASATPVCNASSQSESTLAWPRSRYTARPRRRGR